MTEFENSEWQHAADQVHTALIGVLVTAPDSAVEEADWRFDDEDWLRDAIESCANYGRWRLTGEHRFQYLRPEYKVGPVLADKMVFAAQTFFPRPSYLGWRLTHPDWLISEDRLATLQSAVNTYCSARPPNAGGHFGFERYMGASDPRDSHSPPHGGADIVESLLSG